MAPFLVSSAYNVNIKAPAYLGRSSPPSLLPVVHVDFLQVWIHSISEAFLPSHSTVQSSPFFWDASCNLGFTLNRFSVPLSGTLSFYTVPASNAHHDFSVLCLSKPKPCEQSCQAFLPAKGGGWPSLSTGWLSLTTARLHQLVCARPRKHFARQLF